MNETTFGNTPAAKLLYNELVKINSKGLIRSLGKRITNTNTQVADILNSVYNEAMKPSVAANCLRLMRDEISIEVLVKPEPNFYALRLAANVRIGAIKKAMRLCFIKKKVEVALRNPEENCESFVESFGVNDENLTVKHHMYLNDERIHVATEFIGTDFYELYPELITADMIEPNFVDVLNERSTKRKNKTSMVLDSIVTNLTK